MLAQSAELQLVGLPLPSLQRSREQRTQPLGWYGDSIAQAPLVYGAQPLSHVTPAWVCCRRHVRLPFA